MNEISRRRFGALAFGTAVAATAPLFAQENGKIPDVGASQTGLTSWPKGYSPEELGKAVAQRFLAAPHLRATRIIYPEVCAWYGSLEFARVTNNQELIEKLKQRFEPLFSSEAALLPPKGEHVDYSMFGSLPLELYILTQDKKYLDLGLSYADAQWSKPNEQGLTSETRFWVDDMYMITIVQIQAYRATKEKKYLDRAATEMVAYLDKLQQPNGLFFHAPDVPYYWGRGNGWFSAGLSELLREMPKDHPKRERILRGYRTMMASLLKYQSPDGSWRQLIDRPESWPETSGTAMFAFGLISGVRYGWLEKEKYEAAARHAWIALAGYVDQNADVAAVCEGTNKLNSLEYYLLRKRRTGDFHGQSPLLWSAAALLRQV